MCFALLALEQHPDFPLILAANRDEYFARPALPMHIWEDLPQVLGGRDLSSQGSWLSLNRHNGRLALVTNVRQGLKPPPAALSRGKLVRDFVAQPETMVQLLTQFTETQSQYAGFNLLAGDRHNMYYLSNRNQQELQRLPAGLYGLSNAALDSPWPKVQHGKQGLQQLLAQNLAVDALREALFALLSHKQQAADADLPDTGIGLEKERWLSPLFIQGEHYGTRCSTLILIDRAGRMQCYERSFMPNQTMTEVSFILE